MNREIKFRVWDYQKECWAKEAEIKESIGLTFGVHDYFLKDDHEIERWGFCQFTGLKDKNGKEIYEGDIVKGSFVDQDGDDYGFIDYVSFADGKFQCENNADFDLWIYNLEVIGDIYENPELLKP